VPGFDHLRLPDIVSNRLAAFAEATATTPEGLAIAALSEFTNSPKVRRAIRKHRNGASLADLGWMDGYHGQSVDDILSFAATENAYRVLATLAESIEQNWKQTPGSRTGVENDIVAVMALLREVGNGGFDQFFRNSSRRWTFFVKSSLIRIGRPDAARITGEAVLALGEIAGSRFVTGFGTAFDELDKRMREPNSRRDETFEECDQMFYQLTGLPESLLAYAQLHADGILRR
jgi:hypothetical protein